MWVWMITWYDSIALGFTLFKRLSLSNRTYFTSRKTTFVLHIQNIQMCVEVYEIFWRKKVTMIYNISISNLYTVLHFKLFRYLNIIYLLCINAKHLAYHKSCHSKLNPTNPKIYYIYVTFVKILSHRFVRCFDDGNSVHEV